CRINAEDPFKFTPSPGRIISYHPPGGPGIRVDSHIYQGYFVPPNYDSLIGKVIAYGATRDQALRRMRIALSEMVVQGIQTNIPLHQELLLDERFVKGGTSIHYLEQKLAQQKLEKGGSPGFVVAHIADRRARCRCVERRAARAGRAVGQRGGCQCGNRRGGAAVRRASVRDNGC